MHSIISRMMRLLGVIVVGGFVASGLMTAQLKDMQACTWFLIFSAVFAGAFTAIWSVTTYQMQALIGKGRERSSITKQSIIGVSIGVLALFTCAAFVTAGVSATNGADNAYSFWLQFLGGASTAGLCLGWFWAEYAFVEKQK
jgi:membrane-bound metal-dependent hydrolase YbcI (DUF457 family)